MDPDFEDCWKDKNDFFILLIFYTEGVPMSVNQKTYYRWNWVRIDCIIMNTFRQNNKSRLILKVPFTLGLTDIKILVMCYYQPSTKFLHLTDKITKFVLFLLTGYSKSLVNVIFLSQIQYNQFGGCLLRYPGARHHLQIGSVCLQR